MLRVEDLQKDLPILCERRDLAYQNYHQLIGAISILEQTIAKMKEPEKEEPIVKEEQPGS